MPIRHDLTRRRVNLGHRGIRAAARACVMTAIGLAAVIGAPVTRSVAADAFTPEQKKAIETIVKDYLVANPELFLEIQSALEQKMEKVQAEKLKVALKDNAGEIYRRPDAPFAGNPSGDVTVVEFFDYNCGYCKRGLADIAKLIDKDPKIKVVFMELPILSKGSEEAARVALAARMQGKYWDVHRGLLEAKGQVNEAASLKIAEKAGADALLIVTPYYSRPPQRGLVQYFLEVVRDFGLPWMLYHIPGRAAVNVTAWSYVDALCIGTLTCPDLVPDPAAIADGLHDALAELVRAAAASGGERTVA